MGNVLFGKNVVLLGLTIIVLLLAVVIAAAGISARYRSEISLARQNIAGLGSQVIETPCGLIEALIVGSGSPVLVVHGNGGGIDQGLGLAESYLTTGFRWIVPSRFGYLRSPMPEPASPELQADYFACLLDALGIEQTAVFATSAGVTSAVQLALRHPARVSALVLHSPNAPGEAGLVAPPRPVFSALLHSDAAFWALTTYFGGSMQSLVGVPKGFPLTPELQAEVHGALSSVHPISDRAAGMLFDTYVSNPAINNYPLDQIHTPTLVISAVDDPMALHATARTLAAQIPGARLLAIPDGGHLLLGHTPAVRAAIAHFLPPTLAAPSEISQFPHLTPRLGAEIAPSRHFTSRATGPVN